MSCQDENCYQSGFCSHVTHSPPEFGHCQIQVPILSRTIDTKNFLIPLFTSYTARAKPLSLIAQIYWFLMLAQVVESFPFGKTIVRPPFMT